MSSPIKKVNCPNCQEVVLWVDSNAHRPFCSERCKLIDFGEWATEKHSIAGEAALQRDDEEMPS